MEALFSIMYEEAIPGIILRPFPLCCESFFFRGSLNVDPRSVRGPLPEGRVRSLVAFQECLLLVEVAFS